MTVEYFKKLVNDETLKLNSLCDKWELLANENENIPEIIIGDILVCIGKAKLLIRERFNQFNKLINDCETKKSEKEVKLDDLQGFWEMIYFQVEDVTKAFENLELIKQNDWKVIVKEDKKVQQTKTKIIKKPIVNYSKVKPTFKRPIKTQLRPVNK